MFPSQLSRPQQLSWLYHYTLMALAFVLRWAARSTSQISSFFFFFFTQTNIQSWELISKEKNVCEIILQSAVIICFHEEILVFVTDTLHAVVFDSFWGQNMGYFHWGFLWVVAFLWSVLSQIYLWWKLTRSVSSRIRLSLSSKRKKTLNPISHTSEIRRARTCEEYRGGGK